jgi:hypothetical protein
MAALSRTQPMSYGGAFANLASSMADVLHMSYGRSAGYAAAPLRESQQRYASADFEGW